jgi:uncharacterized protein YbbC (DUF1343 family)
MSKVLTGIDVLVKTVKKSHYGRVGLLCHAASVNKDLKHSMEVFQDFFGENWISIFSPQHGLVGNVQDNMVESEHFLHPFFKRPVYSLYSETRMPKTYWLSDIDTLFVDLQDVGCRIYTYIYSLSLVMKVAQETGTKIVVLDRPNPIGGLKLEGNLLEEHYSSFVGMHPMICRHGMTMGEIAQLYKDLYYKNCSLEVISMENWKREMIFTDTQLPWVMPSPNLATPEAAFTFVGTVLFEGTNISEGRGTTHSLEIVGHPHLEPWSLQQRLTQEAKRYHLSGCYLRPLIFLPTFQKHAGVNCGGYQLHVTNKDDFHSWRWSQMLMHVFYQVLGEHFSWKQPPYEYEYHKLPMDLINGCENIRLAIESGKDLKDIFLKEEEDCLNFGEKRKPYLLY